jgi:hypothetical protein
VDSNVPLNVDPHPHPGREAAAHQATGLLLGAVTGHDAWLVAIVILAILLIGTVAAIVLVSLAHKDDRVDAIRAAAEVLAALLPWPSRRHTPGKPRRTRYRS